MIVNVCIAFDSFKDCVTSRDLSFQLSHILSFRNDTQITVFPVADMYDPQKRATKDQIVKLDNALRYMSLLIQDQLVW